MAFLFKRTDLQVSWPVNLTCLVPVPRASEDDSADLATPAPGAKDPAVVLDLDLTYLLPRR